MDTDANPWQRLREEAPPEIGCVSNGREPLVKWGCRTKHFVWDVVQRNHIF